MPGQGVHRSPGAHAPGLFRSSDARRHRARRGLGQPGQDARSCTPRAPAVSKGQRVQSLASPVPMPAGQRPCIAPGMGQSILGVLPLARPWARAGTMTALAPALRPRPPGTRSPSALSYRRFCRLDDVSAQYWSQSWLASANSLDNPAFCPSEEVLHLQVLDNGCCSCKDDSLLADSCKLQPTPPLRAACQPR